MMHTKALLGGMMAAMLCACTVGPDYVRPDVATPASFRFAVQGSADAANVEWWKEFGDPTLVDLINRALAQNWDLKAAAARVDQAGAILLKDSSGLYPSARYSGVAERARVSESTGEGTPVPNPNSLYEPLIDAGWQLDLWGRIRRQSQAAQANLVGAEEARRGVVLTLVASVAEAYLRLRALDAQLQIAKETQATYGEQLQLFQDRFTYGQISEVTLSQVQAEYETASAAVPQIEAQIGTTENALSVLIGQPPQAIPRGRSFAALRLPRVPAGLPSDLLTRRPDIAQAEADLIAANADIGAAEALLYPNVSLTGSLGRASDDLGNLLDGSAASWAVGADLVGPIFNGGLIRGGILVTKAQKAEAVANYQQAILNALREVSDGLVDYTQSGRRLVSEQKLVAAQETTARLAMLSFNEGMESYTTVLIAQEDLFESRLSEIQTRYDMMASMVRIYKAMGGGWVDKAAVRAPQPQPTPTVLQSGG
ncbi:efflux transporter outer membrane subunit [Neotabrizicola shimadae]|uniref:Efflux transporter outer membrane subunit n=1 Tax=Neotabrizicola shimadae TaxID=2807096 RepID=A0A8G0ZX29_9RHOB|nr:efflux transporter outer membrane subunit [Neotabrizicola shimadae]QYZ69624.1 efflux transporter outer membrane subunit [Neotabrizicola shimadae]